MHELLAISGWLLTIPFFVFYIKNKSLIEKSISLEQIEGLIISEKFTLEAINKELEAKKLKLDKLKTELRRVYEFENLTESKKNLEQEISALKEDVQDLENKQFIGECKLYTPIFELSDSKEYKERIKALREKQKDVIKKVKEKTKKSCVEIDGNKRAGKSFFNDLVKTCFSGFNSYFDHQFKKLNLTNFYIIEERLENEYEKLQKTFLHLNIELPESYLKIKIQELDAAYKQKLKREEEKEAEREKRRELKEEELYRKQIEQEIATSEIEIDQISSSLMIYQEKLKVAKDEDYKLALTKIKELEESLEKAIAEKDRKVSQAQLTRSGYVYIISNIGSFGENVYKIGMTRRLDPMERVNELGDASVPFPFDVHAFIYSEDAPALERKIQSLFQGTQVNKMNGRKEFFKLNFRELREFLIKEDLVEEDEINEEPIAEQYRFSISLVEQNYTKTIQSAV